MDNYFYDFCEVPFKDIFGQMNIFLIKDHGDVHCLQRVGSNNSSKTEHQWIVKKSDEYIFQHSVLFSFSQQSTGIQYGIFCLSKEWLRNTLKNVKKQAVLHALLKIE